METGSAGGARSWGFLNRVELSEAPLGLGSRAQRLSVPTPPTSWGLRLRTAAGICHLLDPEGNPHQALVKPSDHEGSSDAPFPRGESATLSGGTAPVGRLWQGLAPAQAASLARLPHSQSPTLPALGVSGSWGGGARGFPWPVGPGGKTRVNLLTSRMTASRRRRAHQPASGSPGSVPPVVMHALCGPLPQRAGLARVAQRRGLARHWRTLATTL